MYFAAGCSKALGAVRFYGALWLLGFHVLSCLIFVFDGSCLVLLEKRKLVDALLLLGLKHVCCPSNFVFSPSWCHL